VQRFSSSSTAAHIRCSADCSWLPGARMSAHTAHESGLRRSQLISRSLPYMHGDRAVGEHECKVSTQDAPWLMSCSWPTGERWRVTQQHAAGACTPGPRGGRVMLSRGAARGFRRYCGRGRALSFLLSPDARCRGISAGGAWTKQQHWWVLDPIPRHDHASSMSAPWYRWPEACCLAIAQTLSPCELLQARSWC
jgi:hypothetical protein